MRKTAAGISLWAMKSCLNRIQRESGGFRLACWAVLGYGGRRLGGELPA